MEKIIKEFLTPIIEKELHLKQVSDYVWANNYNDLGMRKVLSLYFMNNSYATLKWGWNFEFIPKSVGSKLVWAKTDKSIYTHIFEFSESGSVLVACSCNKKILSGHRDIARSFK